VTAEVIDANDSAGEVRTEPVAPSGPGAALRQAREAKGHTVAEVVQVIRFSAHQIEALERDEYAQLPGATSVRGLVRNYAKFLKVDPEPLLAQLDPAVPVPEADVRPPTNMGEAEQASLGERVPLRMFVIVGAALILGLGVFWFVDSPIGGPSTVKSRVADRGQKPPAAPQGEQSAAVSTAPPSASVLTTPSLPAGNVAVVPWAGLRVEFDDRSWIEIRDAMQKVVLVGEFSAGSKHDVEGKPPYQLWIGRASAVRVFLGDRSIDLKPHTREEVARLTVE
jgi:cytoskeleton protein RodZ